MRDPTRRLGAGTVGGDNDMQALRSHPFFAPINWGVLWTDPAPPLEAGLVKKPPPKEGRTSGINSWEDVGAAWDEMVDGARGDDEISWASEGEDQHLNKFKFGSASTTSDASAVYEMATKVEHRKDAVGPMGEERPYASSPPASDGSTESGASGRRTPRPPGEANGHVAKTADPVTSSSPSSGVRFAEAKQIPASEQPRRTVEEPPDSGTEADEDRDTVPPTLDIPVPVTVRTLPIDVPVKTNGVRDSYSTGSATSSSDGSPPMGTLDAALDNLKRGRNRVQTPLQTNGNGAGEAHDEEAWYVSCFSCLCCRGSDTIPRRRSAILMQGESVVFNSTVEKSALKRRASRLLAIAGAAPWRKQRELVLTDKRLLCLKLKPGRSFQMSSEFFLRAGDSKDTKNVVVGVEPKGEREIVVLTVRFSRCRIRDLAKNVSELTCVAHRDPSHISTSPPIRRLPQRGSARSGKRWTRTPAETIAHNSKGLLLGLITRTRTVLFCANS